MLDVKLHIHLYQVLRAIVRVSRASNLSKPPSKNMETYQEIPNFSDFENPMINLYEKKT